MRSISVELSFEIDEDRTTRGEFLIGDGLLKLCVAFVHLGVVEDVVVALAVGVDLLLQAGQRGRRRERRVGIAVGCLFFTATVSGSAPTGTVNFLDGATSIAGCARNFIAA